MECMDKDVKMHFEILTLSTYLKMTIGHLIYWKASQYCNMKQCNRYADILSIFHKPRKTIHQHVNEYTLNVQWNCRLASITSKQVMALTHKLKNAACIAESCQSANLESHHAKLLNLLMNPINDGLAQLHYYDLFYISSFQTIALLILSFFADKRERILVNILSTMHIISYLEYSWTTNFECLLR